MTTTEALKLALDALEVAQDNLRDHGDNCFLHDEGEYNRCFCGKDSLSNHLQSVVEKLDEALNAPLAEQPAPVAKPHEQEPVNQRAHEVALRQWDHWKQYALELQEKLVKYEGGAPMVLNTSPPAQRTWVGLTDEEIAQGCKESWVTEQAWQSAVWWAEAKLKEKNCG